MLEIWNKKDASDLESWTCKWFSLANIMNANNIYVCVYIYILFIQKM